LELVWNLGEESPFYLLTLSVILGRCSIEDFSVMSRIFVEEGKANVNLLCGTKKRTALIEASLASRQDVTQLIAAFPDTNASLVDISGNSAMHYIFSSIPVTFPLGEVYLATLPSTVKLLHQCGAKFTEGNYYNATPLNYLLRIAAVSTNIIEQVPQGQKSWPLDENDSTSDGPSEKDKNNKITATFLTELCNVLKLTDSLDAHDTEGFTLAHRFIQFGRVDLAVKMVRNSNSKNSRFCFEFFFKKKQHSFKLVPLFSRQVQEVRIY